MFYSIYKKKTRYLDLETRNIIEKLASFVARTCFANIVGVEISFRKNF